VSIRQLLVEVEIYLQAILQDKVFKMVPKQLKEMKKKRWTMTSTWRSTLMTRFR